MNQMGEKKQKKREVGGGRYSRVNGPEAEGLTLSLLSPLSLQETSSSDSRKEEHGEEEASTSSNFLFSIPLMARRIST